MKIQIVIAKNDGEVAAIELKDGSKRLFNRLEGSAGDFLSAFPEGAIIKIKQEWLKYGESEFSFAMSVMSKLRNGAGYIEAQLQQITVAVPSALHSRLNEWNAKRVATDGRMQQIPRTLRYDFLRSEGIPAAVAKGLRDKPSHLDTIPLQGNKGGEVQVTSNGIRVPVLDRQAIIPVAWPEQVAEVRRISFAQQAGDWNVTIYWVARVEQQAEEMPVESEEAEVAAA
jgi:hypothetical protein